MKPSFTIGDSVWIAGHKNTTVKKDCPICFGRRSVRLILGDDSEWETPCEFCGKGFEGPRGWVEVYEWENRAFETKITGMHVSTVDAVKYDIADGWADAENMFATESEALERCAVLKAEWEKQEAKNMESRKEYDKKDYSWHVGYHRRCLKEAQRQVAYHEAKAVFMGMKVKPKKGKAAS